LTELSWLLIALNAVLKITVCDYLYLIYLFFKSRDSSAGIALGYGLEEFYGSIPGGGWEFLSSPPCPERFWGPPSLLSNGYQGLFPWG
jgi:hypothetical protein